MRKDTISGHIFLYSGLLTAFFAASPAFLEGQAAVVYEEKAFLPAWACYSVDVSPDDGVIYAPTHFGDWDDGVSLYDAHTYALIKVFHSLPNVPKYILASADVNYFYATCYYGGSVVKLRASTAELVKSIPVGPWPVGMVFDSARRYLYVMVNCPYSGAEGWISIVDTSTDTILGTIGPISAAGDVLAISPDDKFLYAIGSGAQTLYKMSITDRSVVASVAGVEPGGMSVSPEGNLLYVANRSGGAVRVFQTNSMTELASIPVADVNGFWVAPSGDHGLAVCLAPGSSELLIRVVGLPGGEILQTLSQTLELPDALSTYPLMDPIFWSRTTGEAFIPIFREHGGVLVVSPAKEVWQVVYQSDFSADPGWTTNSPQNFYWKQADGTYYFKRTNGAEQYSFKSIPFDPETSYQLEFDVYMTRCDWAACLFLGLGDPDMHISTPATWYVSYHKVDQGQTAALIFYDSDGSYSHPGGSQPAPFQLNTWYHNLVAYDPAAGTLSLRVTKVSDGSFVGQVDLGAVGSFAGVDRLYISSVGHTYASGATAEGYIDNLVLKSIAAVAQPPVITQFAINSGAATTQSRTVTLNNTTENSPTQYMASESSGFGGATWQTYSTGPQFILSSGDGQKTVYFKTKNAAGESNVVSYAITLQQAAAIYKLSAFLPARSCYSADMSPDGNVIYASAGFGSWDEGVRLYNARTYEHIRDIHSLPNVPKYILASADGIHLYATAYYQGAVVKVRVADAAVVKSISVGSWPVGMVFDSARRYLYVMVNCPYPGAVGSISIIDTSTDTVVGTIGPIVHAGTVLAISPDDQFLYAISYALGTEPQTLYKMTIADRSVLAVPGVRPGGISVSPDGQLLYVADRFAGAVRVFQTSSMTETTPIPVADVHGFWVAPSGDHGLAVCLAPGSDELLIRVVGLPGGEILQTLSQTLELPDGLSTYPLVDPVFWNRMTGELLIPIFREHGGVIVLSALEEAWQVVYQTDFSTDPQWVTDQPSNYYWNQAAGTYHAKVENNAPGHRPNRYFYKAVTWTGDSLEVEWDVKITRMDWSGGVCFGLFDEDLALGGFEGGQGVQLVFGHPDEGLVLAFYATGATGLAQVDSKAGPRYSTNVWYTCKISSDAAAGEVSVEVKDRSSGSSVWSKSLSVPGRFAQPLVRLGGSWSGFGETGGGYSGVDRWAIAEAEIDNVLFKRAGAAPQPPVVTQFAINGGAATTQTRTVSLNNTTTNNPTHYMASENSGFSGAVWQPYSTAPQFILRAGDGQKTVYFKTKNAVGESNVVSDAIQLTTSVPPGPDITTTSLPNGVEGRPYNQVLQVSGGVAPYTWSTATGKLPDGLSLDPNTGVISGTPTSAAIGTSTFTVRVTDGQSAGDTIYVFGGTPDGYGSLSSVEKYELATDAWTFVSPMNEPRYNMGLCTDGQGRFYAVAGQSENVLQTVERYDPVRDEWEYLAPLPIAVGGPAAFTFDGEIYAVGGWMPGYTNRCFIYSPGTDTWSEGPGVYETFGHAGPVVSLSGIPYLIGGHLDRPSWSIRSAVSILVREGADLVWKPSTPLQRRRQGVGVTLGLDGLIYAIGGDQEPGSSGHLTTETVERFSEATKAWQYVQSMPGKRAFAGAVTDSSGRIWVVGGTDWTSPSFFDSVLCYDPGTDSWTAMTSRLNTGRGGHGIAIVRGKGQTDEQELSITIAPASKLTVTTTSLPAGVEGQPYSQTLEATGGLPPYTWSIGAGNLPDGLTLDPNTGIISGTPTNAAIGTSTLTVRVRDSESTGDTIYVFGGLHDAYGNLKSVERYDPVADAWTFVSPMNELRFNHGFGTDDQGRVYAIGGTWYGGSPTATVERYDPARDVWEYVAPMPQALCSAATFTWKGEICSVGGWDGGRVLRVCYIYSPGTNTWRVGPSMYSGFYSGIEPAAATVGSSDTPYVIGSGSGVAMLVEEGVDLVWKPTTPLVAPRSNPAAAGGLDGYVYAIGGLYTNTVERFDEATKIWQYILPMGVKRMAGRSVTDSLGRIWVVGGIDGTSPVYLDSVERYDPATGSWTMMTSRLNTGRGGHGIAIVRGKGQTDEQELSITILPQGPWQTVYSTDFSTDPKWTTNDAANLSWDSATGTFHGWQSNLDGTYAYTPIELTSGASFRLTFDTRINSVQWSAGLTFGLFDPRLMYNAGAVIDFSLFDVGYTTALYAGNPSGPPDWEVSNWEIGMWYRNVIEYDAESRVITLEVRRRDNGALIAQLSLSGISSFPPGMVLLGASRIHMAGYNDAAVDFNLDNIILEEFYQPPKREVEILPLAGPLLRISWNSEVGKEYQLWATSDLSSGEWIPVGPRMGGTGGKLYIDDYVEGLGNRFYRVEVISPAAESPDYAMVVSESTLATDRWDGAVNTLISRHTARLIPFSGSPFPAPVKEELAALHPRYVCFVAQPTEVTDAFVENVHELTRQLDEDPFGDCLWGIITGARPDDALRLASASSPIEIQKALLKTGGDFLEWLPAGVYHSEGRNEIMWVKLVGGEIDKLTVGPYDDTEFLASPLNKGLYQLFVTSGHATEYNWQLHWPDPDGEGFFYSHDGQLYAVDHEGARFDINVPQPLIYWAPGNCLIGRIAGEDSMALGWLGSGGAVQVCGYVVPTWYGYMGWGMSDYFLKLQNRFSFAESFFLTNQALIFDQLNATPGTNPDGLAYDKNAVVLYGDPALRATVSPCRAPLYDQSLEATQLPSPGQFRVVLTITMNESTELPRPVIAFLPFRIVPSETRLEQSTAKAVEIADDMVLAQLWTQGDLPLPAGQKTSVTFTCIRAS